MKKLPQNKPIGHKGVRQFSWKQTMLDSKKQMEQNITRFEKHGNGDNAMRTKKQLLKLKRSLQEKYNIA